MKSDIRILDGLSVELVQDAESLQTHIAQYLDVDVDILRVRSPELLELARRKATRHVEIWGTIPPSDRILMLGEVDKNTLNKHYCKQAEAIAAHKPDAILLESFVELEEAIIAYQAVRKQYDGPVGVSMVFGSGPDFTATVMEVECDVFAKQLAKLGADFLGCQDGLGIDEMSLVVREMRSVTDLPLLACPMAGQRELVDDKIVYRETPENFASKISALIHAGATLIGGGAGVESEHISKVSEELRKLGQ